MAKQFVVARGCNILLSSGKQLRAGFIVTEGKKIVVDGREHPPMDAKKIERHLRSGYLKHHSVLREEGPITPEQFTENPPGKVKAPALPGPGKEDGISENKALTTAVSNGISTSVKDKEPSTEQTAQVTSKWVLDPALLEGKTIDELNVMIVERDPKVEPFATAEEAVAWLSQDRNQVEAVKEMTASSNKSKKGNKDSQVATG